MALKKLNDKQLKAEAAHKDVLASVEGPLDAAVQEAAVQLSELDKQRQQKEAAKQRAEEEVKKLKKQRDEFDVSSRSTPLRHAVAGALNSAGYSLQAGANVARTNLSRALLSVLVLAHF